jgi:3-deoxy-D-manno-octulosonate 8-phosphate phosphatase (KDO 8-P phosphatase)
VSDALERARPLRLMAFDVDGVLTDGVLYYTHEGTELKAFHTLDGLGLKLLAHAGVKLAVFERVRGELRLDARACGFMGDDLPDLPVLTRCGFAATVPDAPEAVRSRAHYVSRTPGGRGAAREVCDLILRAQGAFDAAIARYLG